MANRLNVEMNLDLTPFEKALGRLQTKLGALSKQMQDVGSTLSQNLTLPILGVGAASVKAFADMEKLNKGLTAIMGSSDMAAEELQKLREVAKLPGLGLKEAVQGSINLQAVGLSADEARSTLFGFGKALAAVGKGKFELEAIQYQLTQMISKNKLLAEDYKVIQSNLPLMAAGMEAAFGTNNIEAIRETGISAKEFTLRLSEALAKLPQTQNVTGGLANAFENFSDNVFVATSELGGMIAGALNLEGVLRKVTNGLEGLVRWFGELSPLAKQNVVFFAAFAASVGPVLFVIGKLAGGISVLSGGLTALGGVFTALTGPVGLFVLALTSLGALAFSVYQNYKLFNPTVETFNDYISQGTKNLIAEQAQFNSLISIVKDANVSTSTRSRLMSEINQKYGSYLPNLLSEKSSIDDIKAAQEGANKAFSEKIKLTALQGIVEKQTARLVELAQQEYEIEQQLSKQRKQTAQQLPQLTNAQFTYGQTSAQLTNENIQQAASLRELEQKLKNVRGAQKQLTDATKQTQANLSKLLPGIEPTVTGGKEPTTPTAPALPIAPLDTKALLAQEKAISNITSNIAKLAQTAKGPFGFVRAELSKITVLTPELNKQKDALLEYQKAILQVSNQAAIFGENPLDAQLRATESALSSALETFGPYSEAVRVLADEYDRLKEAVNDNKLATEQANKEQQFAIELQNVFANAFQAGANAIANAGKGVTEALRAVGRAALQAAGDVLRAKIIEGVASVVADSLKKFGLVGLAVAAGAGAAAGALFQSTIGRITTPKLAKGGLAFGQTMAVVGDNPGARTDPEVIAPLSKLKDYLNPAGGAFVAEARISGTDLLILVNNADRANKRVR